MGYDSDQFVQALEEDLFCSICQEVFRNPSEVRCCRQLYCQPCLDDWFRRSRTCPLCRKALAPADLIPPHPIIRNMLGRLLIRCDRSKEGCNFTGRLSDLDKHESEECAYRLVPCPTGCAESVQARSLDGHRKTCTHNTDPHDIREEFLVLQKRLLALEARLAFQSAADHPSREASPSAVARSPVAPSKAPASEPPSQAAPAAALLSLPSHPSASTAVSAPSSVAATAAVAAAAAAVAGCAHRWVRDNCRICAQCLQCTEYGRSCVCQRDNPGRRVQAGDVCGCGSGVAGCTFCKVCWRCAGLPRAPSVR